MRSKKNRLLGGPISQAAEKMIAALPMSDAKAVWQSDIEVSDIQLKANHEGVILSFDVLGFSKVGNPHRVYFSLIDNRKNNFLDDPATLRKILSHCDDPHHKELYTACRGGLPFDPQFFPKSTTFWSAKNPSPAGKNSNRYNLAIASISNHWGYFNENHYVQRENKIIPAFIIPGLGVAILFAEKFKDENVRQDLNILIDILLCCAKCDDKSGTFFDLKPCEIQGSRDYLDFIGNNPQGFSRIKANKEFYYWLFEFLYTQISNLAGNHFTRDKFLEVFGKGLKSETSKVVEEAIETIQTYI